MCFGNYLEPGCVDNYALQMYSILFKISFDACMMLINLFARKLAENEI